MDVLSLLLRGSFWNLMASDNTCLIDWPHPHHIINILGSNETGHHSKKAKAKAFPSMPGASVVTFTHTVLKDHTSDRWGPMEAHDTKQVKWDFLKPCFQDIRSATWQRLALPNPLSPPSCNYTLYRAHNLHRVLIISKCWGAKSLHSAIKQIPGYR